MTTIIDSLCGRAGFRLRCWRNNRVAVVGPTRVAGLVAGLVAAALLPAQGQEQAGRVGRAVVVALTRSMTATYPDRTAHDYPQGRLELSEGMALSELHKITTDKRGRGCLVMTPGALLCIQSDTTVMIDRLEQMTQGLPETGKDLQRRIELTVQRGGILLHAGPSSSTMMIKVKMPGAEVTASGGEFLVVEDKGKWVVGCGRDRVAVNTAGGSLVVEEGRLVEVQKDESGKTILKEKAQDIAVYRQRFDMCTEFFPELEKMVFLPYGVDTGRLQAWIGTPGGIVPVGDPILWADVTPSMRVMPGQVQLRTPEVADRGDPSGRWASERIWEWYRNAGVIRGVNYIPRTAVNSIEFWQKQGFQTNIIDEELEWASDMGFNSIRVMLSFAVWSGDPDGFRDRMRQLLGMAREHGLSVVPVLFDDLDVAGREPAAGPQPDPVPGVHNSQWVPNPGKAVVEDKARWGDLERYVRDITSTFYRDRGILFWDLYNIPGSGAIGEKSLPLLESAFRWAREARARQPITAVAWGELSNPISSRLMEMSDIITFQSFGDPVLLRARLRTCEAHKRPVFCSDWLNRKQGGTFEAILPVLAENKAGWYSRGLVKGRAQFYIPDDHRSVDGQEPKVWQQDVLWPDGKPYDRKEMELIKAFNFDFQE